MTGNKEVHFRSTLHAIIFSDHLQTSFENQRLNKEATAVHGSLDFAHESFIVMSSSSTALSGAFASRSEQHQPPQARMSPYAHSIRVHGSQVPEQWLVRTHDPRVYAPGVVQTRSQVISSNQDMAWTAKRDHVIAAAAAGIHLAAFAFSVAFWGFEGQPPDRYWPSAIRYEG